MFLLGQSTHRMVIQHHPTIGHLFVPNLNARLPGETGGYFVRTNAQGFRSDLEFEPRRGDRPRILFFGDSYTAGDGCDNQVRFAERVGEQFGAEVYNYGLSGSGTDQQLLIYEELARDVEADLIVLCVMVENIERIQVPARETIDRVTGQRVLVPKPYFELESGELRLRQVPVPRERARADSPDAGEYQQTFANRHPQLVKMLDAYRRDPRLKRVRDTVERFAPGLRSQILRAGNYTPYPDYGSPSSPGWRLMEAICRRFCESVGDTPLLIVPIPPYWFYYDGLKPNYRERFASLEDRSRNKHVADITAPFLRLPRAERRQSRFPIDPHYSTVGHQHVANFIGDAIRERGLLPEPASSRPAPRPAKKQGKAVLGISCFYHNSAAALVRDGEIVAAGEEERFSRIKNDRRFPHHSINFCLEQAGLHQNELDAIVYYDNAALTFERLLHTLAAADEGDDAFSRAMPSWIHYKLHIPQLIRRYLHYDGEILQEEHHRSHAASCFLPSPFDSAAILTVDGVGEWATACIGKGKGSEIELLKEMHFPHSLGLLYSAFTQFTGFKVNSGEYKMMGLAPYGEPRYVDTIRDNIVDIKQDGSIELNLDYFSYLTRPTMTNEKFAQLFGGPARQPDDWISQRERDISRSIQVVTEEVVLRMARHGHELSGEKQLCMAGGVALNCVSNGRLLREGPFEDIWIQPAAGDSGAALGAALDAYHNRFDEPRQTPGGGVSLQRASLLGPSFGPDEIRAGLETHAYPYHELEANERSTRIAQLLAEGKVVGHFTGRAEFGPRSLGARSILGDPRNQTMQSNLNLKIKYRESFRPFAPSVLRERCSDYFELDTLSPYMLIVAPVREDRRLSFERGESEDLREIVNRPRSDLPAITHVDYSARIQTVDATDSPVYHDLIEAFEAETGCAVVVNTSFNVRGEPIVLTPHDAYRCFMRTEMDVLVLENFILYKHEQPEWPEPKGHVEEHEAPTTEVPPLLRRELKSFYEREFRPASRSLREARALHVSIGEHAYAEATTTWTPHRQLASADELFRIPAELDSDSAEPKQMADALSKAWGHSQAAPVFRDVVEKLLEIGRRVPAEEQLDEEVSESVYVMF